MKPWIASTVLVIPAITILGSSIMFGQGEYREEFSFNKPVAGLNELDISNINGYIQVVGVDGLNEVRITGQKIVKAGTDADARSHIGEIKINLSEASSALRVKTEQPNGKGGVSYNVNYEIQVPRAWKVISENVNGSVKLSKLQSAMKADVTNGSVDVIDVAGALDISVTNGSIHASGAIPERGACNLETVNGTISGRLDIARNVSCKVESTNGQVNLEIPRGSSTKVAAETNVGGILTNSLTLANQQKTRVNMTGAQLSGTLGDGTGNLHVTVQNGSIALNGY